MRRAFGPPLTVLGGRLDNHPLGMHRSASRRGLPSSVFSTGPEHLELHCSTVSRMEILGTLLGYVRRLLLV